MGTVGAVLIAERFVLLALRPDGRLARGATSQSSVATGVTGALVAELAFDGHLAIDAGRIRLTGTRPAHPMLAQALENIRPHEGKTLKSRLGSIRHSGWSEVVDGMVDAGVLGHEGGALRPTRHPSPTRSPTPSCWPTCAPRRSGPAPSILDGHAARPRRSMPAARGRRPRAG